MKGYVPVATGSRRDSELLPVRRDEAGLLYEQVKESLRSLITARGLQVGEKLPTIRELCSALNVSRQTITRALDDLAYEGVVHRIQGKGILVARNKFDNPFDSLVGLTEALGREGIAVESAILSVREIAANPYHHDVFASHYAEVDTVFEFRRLRRVDGVPAIHAISYVPTELGRRMSHLALENRSFYEVLALLTGGRVAREDHVISLIAVDSALARALRVAPGSQQFFVTGETYLADGRPVEASASVFRSDMFRFKVKSFDFTVEKGITKPDEQD